ncbi:undecaprenyl phosphate translocase family protein [Enterocloster sp.]|uniref:undecaprenyl phosphate translocase family protein n=1 Tax=Enterocloster sp. TaxID=2719315 RepID=UPI00399FFA57
MLDNQRENIKTLLKGAWVGGTMTVPGVSGGSMAMVLGIYDRLITSVSRIFKEPGKSIPFLLWFAVGGCAGIVLFPEASACCLPQKRQFRPGSSF